MKRRSILIAAAVGAAIVALVCFVANSGTQTVLGRLCDGCFVAGVLLAGCGGLGFAGKCGMFDIFAFGIRAVLHIRWPWTAPRKEDAEKETYADYKLRMAEKRKTPVALLVVGGAYLLLAGLLLILYYQV